MAARILSLALGVAADQFIVGGKGATELFLCSGPDHNCVPSEFDTGAPGLNCALGAPDGAAACLWATELLGQVGFQVEGTSRFYIGGYSALDAWDPGSGILQVDLVDGGAKVTQTSMNLGTSASIVSLTSAEGADGKTYLLAGTNQPSVVFFDNTLQETARVMLNNIDPSGESIISLAHDIAVVDGMVYVANLQIKEVAWFPLEAALNAGGDVDITTLAGNGAVRDIDPQAGPRQLLHHDGSMFVLCERTQPVEPGMQNNFFRFEIGRGGFLTKRWGTSLGPVDVGEQPHWDRIVNFLAEIVLVGDTIWITDRLADMKNPPPFPTPELPPRDYSRVYRIPLGKAMEEYWPKHPEADRVETIEAELSYAWGMSVSPDGETVAVIGSGDHRIAFYKGDDINYHTLTDIRGFGPFLSYVNGETDNAASRNPRYLRGA